MEKPTKPNDLKTKKISVVIILGIAILLFSYALVKIKHWEGKDSMLFDDRGVHEYCIRRANTMHNYMNCVNEIHGGR